VSAGRKLTACWRGTMSELHIGESPVLRTLLIAFLFLLLSRLWHLLGPFFPFYVQLGAGEKVRFAVSLNSLVHASVSFCWALYILLTDTENLWKDRIFYSSRAIYQLLAFSNGYFLWDTCDCWLNFTSRGLGLFLHAILCFIAYSIGMQPLVQPYGLVFLLNEASTPFLNMYVLLNLVSFGSSSKRTFSDSLSSSSPSMVAYLIRINGLFLILTFFVFRIILGTIWSVLFLSDVILLIIPMYLGEVPLLAVPEYPNFPPISTLIFAEFIYLCLANVILNGLNIAWFKKMLDKAFYLNGTKILPTKKN